MSIKLKKFDSECFFDYVKTFHGKEFTDKEITIGINEYLKIVTKSYWGDGDTADRENVLVIMMSNRHDKIEKQIKKLSKELKRLPKLKDRTLECVCETLRKLRYS
jgi:hypothetical protein